MTRLDQLEQRRYDEAVIATLRGEVYKSMRESDAVRYTIGAMQPIDPEYTKNTFAQGDRVKSQLEQRLDTSLDFEYQGSVTTDTHIKARSDIDLLMIRNGWHWVEPPQNPEPRYAGDGPADMRRLRIDAANALRTGFPRADVDESGSTALKISGASLRRDVDVVPATWYNTNRYAETRDKTYRGVKVFDKNSSQFAANTPFLYKRQIQEKDERTRGGLRKAIRLMKSLMYDSQGRVDMSSYNIAALGYSIDDSQLLHAFPRELTILEACWERCRFIRGSTTTRESVLVPDGSRPVFGGPPGASLAQLGALTDEIERLRKEILEENVRSFVRLAEARVEYPIAQPS